MKKGLLILLVFALCVGVPKGALATENEYYFLRAESFSNSMGTWTIDSDLGAFDGMILFGKMDLLPQNTTPAVTYISVKEDKTFHVFARVKDYLTNRPGSRFCSVRIGDGLFEQKAGIRTDSGYRWEKLGQVQLAKGDVKVELMDSSAHFSRFCSLFITNDLSYIPPENYELTLQKASVLPPAGEKRFEEEFAFPAYVKAAEFTGQTASLKNDFAEITFAEAKSEGKTIIKQKTVSNGQEVLGFNDPFGYLIVYAKKSRIEKYQNYTSPSWENVIDYKGSELTITTADVFSSGVPSWIVPSEMKVQSQNKIEITGENSFARLRALWELAEGEKEPKVTVTLTAKQEGFYTIGMFSGGESPYESLKYLNASLPFMNKFLPPMPLLVSESCSPTASSFMTVEKNGEDYTFGVTIDPSFIPYRFAYTDNQRFGMGIRGNNNGVWPSAFAPVMGMADSLLKAGQSYQIAYRPHAQKGWWYDTYRHIVTDIFKLKDVRENYYSSVTDAVFNIQDLILDDQHCGWSDIAKGFANMEIKGNFKQPTPLVILAQYNLTEDGEMLRRRAIPTMAYVLTRPEEDSNITGGSNPQARLGAPVSMYSSNIFSGMYYLSSGLTPAFRKIGITDLIDNPTWFNIPTWCEYLYRYNITADEIYLERAKKDADIYIEKKLFNLSNPSMAFYTFQSFLYYPVLLDLYEATREVKYLNAAKEAASQHMTGIWTQPRIPEGEITTDSDWIKERGFFNDRQSVFTYFWNGLTRHRLGNKEPFPKNERGGQDPNNTHYPLSDREGKFVFTEGFWGVNGKVDNLEEIRDETVPAWLTSKIGWSIEGVGTYMSTDCSNVTMTMWAPNFLRLTAYTGDELFETLARHSIIGRAANYPGYYISRSMTTYMKPDYPYTGPDVTNIYYHHIPVYLGMLQDFLFTQSWKWSNGAINFPSQRQYGYVWFDNRVYGFAPGVFFEEEGMWPTLRRGEITVSDINIDYIMARKDGVLGIALMNEKSTESTVTVNFQSLPDYSGRATLYYPDGTKDEVTVTNGKLSLAIAPKSLVGLTVYDPKIKAPAFANLDFNTLSKMQTGNAIVKTDEGFGDGYVLQMEPESYFAHIYLPFKADELKSAEVSYQTNGVWQSVSLDQYPFEAIIEAKTGQTVTYKVKAVFQNGEEKQTKEYALSSLLSK